MLPMFAPINPIKTCLDDSRCAMNMGIGGVMKQVLKTINEIVVGHTRTVLLELVKYLEHVFLGRQLVCK